MFRQAGAQYSHGSIPAFPWSPQLCLPDSWWLLQSPLLHTLFSSVQLLSCVRLFATPWTAARQASLSITNSITYHCDNTQRWQRCKRCLLQKPLPRSGLPRALTREVHIPAPNQSLSKKPAPLAQRGSDQSHFTPWGGAHLP